MHLSEISNASLAAVLFLIVFGSLVAFTAYGWLLKNASTRLLSTYAYVNPVVAVLVGYLFGGEVLGLRTILGTLFVLVSVVVITTTRAVKPVEVLEVKDAG